MPVRSRASFVRVKPTSTTAALSAGRTPAVILLLLAALVVLALAAQPAYAADPLPITSYNLYFGDLHAHTSYSDGAHDTVPADAYAAAMAAGLDYYATTDHDYLMELWEWEETLKMAAASTTESFVAIPGYEFFLRGGGACECNVFGATEMCDIKKKPGDGTRKTDQNRFKKRQLKWTPKPAFYDWLVAHGAVAMYNHPHYLGDDFDDFDHWTPVRDVGMGALEIHNYGSFIMYGYLDEDEPAFNKALGKGWHIMPAANSDTHSADWGAGSPVRTVLLAPSLELDDLVEAIREQRGYATLEDDLRVQYTLDGRVMGETLDAAPETATAWVRVEDPDADPADAVTKLEIVSDGGAVVAERVFGEADGDTTAVEWLVELDASAAQYFYVRVSTASTVTGGPGVTAWTAPVWTGR